MASFSRGDRVEIVSKEEGFTGSYYTATIITGLLNKEYIVQYKTLVKDDNSGPLREIVCVNEVRPIPPEINVSGFGKNDVVDAYDNDGWWVGKITGKIWSSNFVHFETTGEDIWYRVGLLRVHQDWCNGKWVVSKNNGPNCKW